MEDNTNTTTEQQTNSNNNAYTENSDNSTHSENTVKQTVQPSSSDEQEQIKFDFAKMMEEAMSSFAELKKEVNELKSAGRTAAINEPHGEPNPTCEEALHNLFGGKSDGNK